MILIYSERESANVALSQGMVAGTYAGNRTYTAQGHFLALDGDDALLLSEDAISITAINGFRLATAQEQEAYAATSQQDKGAIREQGKGKKSNESNGG